MTLDFQQEQMTDEDIGPILTAKEEGPHLDWQVTCHGSKVLKGYWAQWESVTLENGLLKRAWESADGRDVVMQLIVPRSKVQSVLKEMHDGKSGGHLGVNKTLDKIRKRFYWLHLRPVSYTHLDVYKRQVTVVSEVR